MSKLEAGLVPDEQREAVMQQLAELEEEESGGNGNGETKDWGGD